MSARRDIADLPVRWPAVRPFVLMGSVGIVAGGLVAAVTGPTGFEPGSWSAAYLVLVAGVAQVVLGVGQAWLAEQVPPPSEVRAEAVAWNLSVAGVMAGTLASAPVVTTLGGLSLVVALVLFLAGVRRSAAAAGLALVLYRGLVAIVLVSTPVGLALAWVRHG